MPSRASSYSPAAFSYYDEVAALEARKVLYWTHAGVDYCSTLLIRQGERRRKTEGYLHWWDGRQWAPVRLADGTVSDGLVALAITDAGPALSALANDLY